MIEIDLVGGANLIVCSTDSKQTVFAVFVKMKCPDETFATASLREVRQVWQRFILVKRAE
jgi:hypothetical protein